MGIQSNTTTKTIWCPCCGYDLTAIPPSWNTNCPIEGTCSECGEIFAWASVIRPELVRARWLYEYTSHLWSLKSLVQTYVAALFPNWFLRRVRFEKHVRWHSFIVLFFAIPYTAFAFMKITEFLGLYTANQSFILKGWNTVAYPKLESYISLFTFPLAIVLSPSKEWQKGWLIEPFFRDYALVSLAFAASMSIHVLGYKIPKIPTHHLVRLFLYSLIPASLLLVYRALGGILFYLASVVYYLTSSGAGTQRFPPWYEFTSNVAVWMLQSGIPEFVALIWLPWYWAVVYRKHLHLVRWKYFYLNGFLFGLIFYFLFRGLLA